MPPILAAFIYGCIIVGLFCLDRDKRGSVSISLWLPVIWLFLACSRSTAQWLQLRTPIDSSDQILEGSPIDRLIYTGLLAIGLMILVPRKDRVLKFLRQNSSILLFFGFCLMSLLWSDFAGVAFKRWTKALGDFVMVLIVLTERDPTLAIKKLLSRASFLLVPLSILFIKYYPQLGKGYSRWEGRALYSGVATNKNTLGVICLFFGLGSLWRLLAANEDRGSKTRTRRLIAHSLVLVMVLWLFWIANSMTSTSCFVMAAALLLICNLPFVARRPAFVHLLVVGVLLVCFSILFLGLSPGMLATIGRNPTLTDRTEVWSLVLGLVKNPYFGTGFESYWLGPRLDRIWSIYSWGPTEAHNGYIEVYLNLGWVGIALLSVVLITGYATVIKAYRRNLPTAGLFVAFFTAGIIFNFTEAAFFRMMAPAWVFFLLAITRAPRLAYTQVKPPEKKFVQRRPHAQLPMDAVHAQRTV